MRDHLRAPLRPCDACAVGKCHKCHGEAWDDEADRLGACPCAEAGGGAHE